MRKKTLAALIMLSMCVSAVFSPVLAANPVRVFYSGQEILYDVPPQIVNNRTMVPIRATIETITGSVMGWDSNTRTLSFTSDGHYITHTIGQTVVYVDGQPVQFDTPSLIIDNRTLVPIRMIAETSGCRVDWDSGNRYVIITPHQESEKPGIIGVTASKTTVNYGEGTVLTIRTNAATKYVWVDDGISNTNAAFQSTDASGAKIWSVTCYPKTSRDLTVYANETQAATGAATKAQYITVLGSGVNILNFTVDKTNVEVGGAVTFRIRTNTQANNVWAEFDNASVNANRQADYTNGDKSWILTVHPTFTQEVKIYANTSKSNSGAVSVSQQITIGAAVSIQDFSVNNAGVSYGDTITVTMTTSTAANYAYIDTGFDSFEMTFATSNSTTKTWTVSFPVYNSITIKGYAGASRWGTDAQKAISVTVSNADPKINSATVDRNVPENGDPVQVTFTIRTNMAVDDIRVDTPDASNTAADPSRTVGSEYEWVVTTMCSSQGNVFGGKVEVDIIAEGFSGKTVSYQTWVVVGN